MAELLEAAEVRILRLEPGDELVITAPPRIGQEGIAQLQRQAEERWPGHRVTVLSREIIIEIQRSGSNQEPDPASEPEQEAK